MHKIKEIFNIKHNKVKEFNKFLKHANGKTMASFIIMGLGQLLNRQWIKGIIYLSIQILSLFYFIFKGAKDLIGLFTLGSTTADPWYGIKGDNSIVMMIAGVLAIIVMVVYIVLYIANIKDAYHIQCQSEEGIPFKKFKKELYDFFDKKFHVTTLFLPILGVCIFSILPIIFMIMLAFTNYGGTIVETGALVDWIGFGNFSKIISLKDFADTLVKILGWNFLWAILSTTINYFGGLGLALLYNRKCVKGKAFWRVFPIIAYAIPGFITLLAFRFMFSYGGPINQIIVKNGGTAIGFLDLDAKWSARVIGLFVNAWITIPSGMLLATGILSNANKDVYEAATIDGASGFKQFKKITLPYVIFATTPVLIMQFIGNFNNFGIFYFLRGSLYIDGYFLASDTDLLINWLYNLSINNNYYSIGAAISLIIFIITSTMSLIVYMLSPAYKQEDTYK